MYELSFSVSPFAYVQSSSLCLHSAHSLGLGAQVRGSNRFVGPQQRARLHGSLILACTALKVSVHSIVLGNNILS